MRLLKLIGLRQSEPLSRWHGLHCATRQNHRTFLRLARLWDSRLNKSRFRVAQISRGR